LQNALSKTRAELSRMIRDRDLLNLRIMQLEMNVKSIQSALTQGLSGEDQSVIGVTEAIRTVMRSWGKPMTPREVRLALVAAGFDVKRFKNPSAAIANTLIRMTKTGELYYDRKGKWYGLPGATSVPLLNAEQREFEK